MKRPKISGLAVAMIAALMVALTGCAGGSSAAATDKSIQFQDPFKSFLTSTLPSNYSLYTLQTLWPVTESDVKANGIYMCSRVPDGLLPANVISQLYGGGFPPGGVVTLDAQSDGMDKFDGIPVKVVIRVSPAGCVKGLEKTVVLFSDDDAKKITDGSLVKLTIG